MKTRLETSSRTRLDARIRRYARLDVAANAGEQRQRPPQKSSVVRYDDLNLDTAAGIKILYARLSNAANQVCGSAPDTVDLRGAAGHRACFDSALSNAVDKIGNRNLQALHHEQQHTASGWSIRHDPGGRPRYAGPSRLTARGARLAGA